MYEVKAYHCSFCKKYSTAKSVIKTHEKKCFWNPETKSCASCVNFVEKLTLIETGQYLSEMACSANVPFEVENISKVIYNTACIWWDAKPEESED
jgi:hypothetical protein